MGLDNIRLRVLRELDGFIVSLFSLILEIRGHREGYKKAKLTGYTRRV